MYRREASRTLYRSVARMVWERYRPGALELPVGWALLRDVEVALHIKARAAAIGMSVGLGALALQAVLVQTVGLHRPAMPMPIAAILGLGLAVVATLLAMIRLAEPGHVVRARLSRMAVIPLRRR